MLNQMNEKSQHSNEENTAQFAQQSQQSRNLMRDPSKPDQRLIGLERVAAIDLNNFPSLPIEIKNIIL